jgi:hypothetical protein
MMKIDPIPTTNIELTELFPADSMWAMVFESELEEENDVPSYRPSLGKVPIFSRLIELNGPLFAAKINKTLGRFFGPSVGRNFAFLHPDETVANSLSACVWDLADLDSIAIRSRLIELAEHITNLSTLIERAHQESRELGEYAEQKIEHLRFVTRNASPGSFSPFRVVTLSEFRASGSRMNGLSNLARMYPLSNDNHENDYYYYQFGYGALSEETTFA